MGDVIYAAFTPKTTDGGKARIQAKRSLAEPIYDWRFEDVALVSGRCDLSMGHADVEMPADSAP